MKPQYLSAIFNIHIMKSPGGLFIISAARKRRRKRKFTFFHNENRSGLPPLKVYVNLLMKQPVCISPYYGNLDIDNFIPARNATAKLTVLFWPG